MKIPWVRKFEKKARGPGGFRNILLRLCRRFIRWLARVILSLRYEVTLKGGEQLRNLEGPVLVMPNHSSYVDPAIVLTQLGRFILLRPMVFEGSYRNPLVYPIMKLINAVEIPNLEQVNFKAKDQTLKILHQLEKSLKRGECLLVYPSGRLQHRGAEEIGPTRAASELLSFCPSTTVVLVRITGLWGSMFGFAPTGTLPNLTETLLRGAEILLASGFFFLPRRKVLLEVEVMSTQKFPGLTRSLLNPYLEAWFNLKNAPLANAEPVYVPYHAWFGPRTFKFPPLQTTSLVFDQEIEPAIQEAIYKLIEDQLGRHLYEFEKGPERWLEFLGLDSLDRMELLSAVELQFDRTSYKGFVPTRIGELWALAQGVRVTAVINEPGKDPQSSS